MAAKLTIKTNGQTLITALYKQDGSTAVSVFTDQNLSSSTSVGTIVADTTYWVSVDDHYILSVKQADGTEIGNSNGATAKLYLAAGAPVEVSPMPTSAQLAADVTGVPKVGVRTPSLTSGTQVADSIPEVGVGPNIITPPGAVIAASAAGAWYAANAATGMRFTLYRSRTYRYVNLHVGTQSGNIQVGVSRVYPSNATSVHTVRVAHSGVIACPAGGAQQIDLGFFTLPPGDYMLFLWCDNTTATFLHGLATGLTASRILFSQSSGLGSGVGATVQDFSTTTRWVSGLTLEAGQFPTVLFGDSITLNQTWFTTVDDSTGNRFSITNKGTSGNTTADLVSRVAADVTASSPRYVTVLGGSNDITNSAISSATTIANLASLYSTITGAGGAVLACTLPPRDNASQGDRLTAAQQTKLREVNAWIRANYTSYSGARLCDWSYALSYDGTDETKPLAANFTDQVHPNSTGAAIMATVLRQAISTWV